MMIATQGPIVTISITSPPRSKSSILSLNVYLLLSLTSGSSRSSRFSQRVAMMLSYLYVQCSTVQNGTVWFSAVWFRV